MKICRDCKKEKDLSGFRRYITGLYSPNCLVCRYLAESTRKKHKYANDSEFRETAKKKSRAYRIMRAYGLSEDQYEALVTNGDKCGLCGSEGRKLVVDHDHTTGLVRGVICQRCNVALGVLGDNESGLARALSYVRGEI